MKPEIATLFLIFCIINFSPLIQTAIERNVQININEDNHLVNGLVESKYDNVYSLEDKIEIPPYIEKYIGTRLVHAIEIDSKNDRVYYSLGNTLGILNLNNNSFSEKFSIPFDCAILKILYEEDTENLFIASTIGLFIISINNWEINFYNESNGLSNNYVHSLAYDEIGKKLFISTFYGLNLLFLNNNSFLDNSILPLELRTRGTGKIAFNDHINSLYLTAGNKLKCYNITSNSLTEIFYSNNYNYDFIRSLYFHNETNILYMGCHGVIIFNCSTNTVSKNYNQTSGLNSNVVHDVTYSANYGGIIFAEQDDNGFVTINISSSEIGTIRREDGLLTNTIGSLKIYNENQTNCLLLIGLRGAISFYSIANNTLNNSLVTNFTLPYVYTRELSMNDEKDLVFLSVKEYLTVFNITSKKFRNYDYVYGLPEASIRQTIYNSENKQVFVSTYLGVYIFSLEDEQVIRSYTTNQGLSNNSTYSLFYLEEENTLYIGTHTGLDKIDLTTNIVSNCLMDIGRVNTIMEDLASERLFLGTSSHLQIFDLVSETNQTVKLGTSDYYKTVTALALHKEDNILFVGTAKGLYLVNSESMSIKNHYTPENSKLTDSLIDGLYFDEESEKLFIANFGVVIYDYRHDFWINLNAARLKEEDLHGIYIEDILYSNDKLYLTAPYDGFYIIEMSDTDQDGIENCFEEWLFKTNIELFDTDSDGYGDGEELWAGTDPLDAKSYPHNTLKWWATGLIISVVPITLILSIFIYRKKRKKIN
ncbi:MAG: hypothetical protein ACTSR1_05520 [Candidatus Heimdallarchaeota archaeon]